jgi:hypothetical protein
MRVFIVPVPVVEFVLVVQTMSYIKYDLPVVLSGPGLGHRVTVIWLVT